LSHFLLRLDSSHADLKNETVVVESRTLSNNSEPATLVRHLPVELHTRPKLSGYVLATIPHPNPNTLLDT
jgi:hypothetical protein